MLERKMINTINDEKVYFVAGQVVTIKHNLENKPKMLVVEKKTRDIVNKDGSRDTIFLGMRCIWFDKNQVMHEGIFSSKDLIHVENE